MNASPWTRTGNALQMESARIAGLDVEPGETTPVLIDGMGSAAFLQRVLGDPIATRVGRKPGRISRREWSRNASAKGPAQKKR